MSNEEMAPAARYQAWKNSLNRFSATHAASRKPAPAASEPTSILGDAAGAPMPTARELYTRHRASGGFNRAIGNQTKGMWKQGFQKKP